MWPSENLHRFFVRNAFAADRWKSVEVVPVLSHEGENIVGNLKHSFLMRYIDNTVDVWMLYVVFCSTKKLFTFPTTCKMRQHVQFCYYYFFLNIRFLYLKTKSLKYTKQSAATDNSVSFPLNQSQSIAIIECRWNYRKVPNIAQFRISNRRVDLWFKNGENRISLPLRGGNVISVVFSLFWRMITTNK